MYKILTLEKLRKFKPDATLRDLVIQMKRLDDEKMRELNEKHSILSMKINCVKGNFGEKIQEIISKKEKVSVIADYDVDGVMSAAIWKEFLDYHEIPSEILIPNRFKDGYGFGESMLQKVIESGCKWIITCDNGIKSNETIEKANSLGMTVIVTDHHQPGEVLPNAEVIANPHCGEQTLKTNEICGAMVSWVLVKDYIENPVLVKSLLELAAVATLADVMPLIKENRTLIKWFITRVKRGENTHLGLDQLIRTSGIGRKAFNEETIAFTIAPLINAAGRLKDAGIAYEALIGKNKEQNHKQIQTLLELNDKRKQYSNYSVQLAMEQIKDPRDCYCVFLEGCPEGIIGIVAGKLTEKTGKPCFVFSKMHNSDKVKGSGRSPINYNLIEGANEVFGKHPELTSGFGGHAGAMGLSLNSVECIKEFEKLMIENYSQSETTDTLVEYVIKYPEGYTMEEVWNTLQEFAPYGEGFKPISFYVKEKISNLDYIKDTHSFFDAKLNGEIQEFCFFHNIIPEKDNHMEKHIVFSINRDCKDKEEIVKFQPYVNDIF